MSQLNKENERAKSANNTFSQKNYSDIFEKSRKIINKIHQNQKRNSLAYKSYQPGKKIKKANSIQINDSINILRQRSHSQRSKASLIQNRIHYIQVATSRQQKLTNIAKQKYLKVNQIRHQSFTQKNILAKQKGIILFQHNKSIKEKVNRIKSEKCLSQISQKEISMKNKKQAQQVRRQRKMNQYLIKSRKEQEQKRKREKAQRIHRSLIISSQKLKNLSKNKIKAGVQNHKKQILHEFENLQFQKKVNEKLMVKFKTQAFAIFDLKMKKQKQLQLYEKYLGLSIGGKKILNFRKAAETKFKSTPRQSSISNRMSKATSISNTPIQIKQTKQQGEFYLTNPQNYNKN